MNIDTFRPLLDHVVTLENANACSVASDSYVFCEELMPEEAYAAVVRPQTGEIHRRYVECLERRLKGLLEIEEAKVTPTYYAKPFTVQRDENDVITIWDGDDFRAMTFNTHTQIPLDHVEQIEAETLRWMAEADFIAAALNKSYGEDR